MTYENELRMNKAIWCAFVFSLGMITGLLLGWITCAITEAVQF